MIESHISRDEYDMGNKPNKQSLKKSKSVDLGKLRRQLLLHQRANGKSDNLHAASKFSHDVVFGHYALRKSSSRCDLLLRRSNQNEVELKRSDCNCSTAISSSSQAEPFEDDVIMKVVVDRRKWTVGRLSLLMLVLFTLTEFLFHVVNAQMQYLESPDHYDALSADVIRPAFKYHSSHVDRITDKARLGLGTAAISSVTTALSPILPFTGGLDLRREDYWNNGLFGSVTSVFQQVRDAFVMDNTSRPRTSFLNTPRGGSTVALQNPKSAFNQAPIRHELSLSDADPFVPVGQIADLTLREVAMAFRYAIESTQEDFNRPKFFQGILPRVSNVLVAMTDAASKSAGKTVKFASTRGDESTQSGDIDALHFCAAMRIFAEWRVLRQVPEGYKGYAVGMSLGHKDVVQNVAKIEQATHSWIDHHRELNLINEVSCPKGACDLRSPTLRDLLEFEIDMNVHDNTKLPRLKDRTGGMGLLWARRQLQYQTAIFVNALQVPKVYKSTKAAVSAAYSEIYDKYHGWAVQKIFNYSFQAAPEADEVYKAMNPHRLKEVQSMIRSDGYFKGQPSRPKLSKASPSDKDGNPVEKFAKHAGKEWEKMTSFFGTLFEGKVVKEETNDVAGDPLQHDDNNLAIEGMIVREMTNDAHENIRDYLEVAKPLLKNLADLFEELNMDDPAKV